VQILLVMCDANACDLGSRMPSILTNQPVFVFPL